MAIKGTFDPIDDVSKIQDLSKSNGWNPRTKEQWEEIISKSRWIYYLYDDDLLIGMCRVVEDGFMAMLYDLDVRKEYQNRGHGTMIVNAILEKLKSKYEFIQLFCEKDMIGYYKRFGFDENRAIGMTYKK